MKKVLAVAALASLSLLGALSVTATARESVSVGAEEVDWMSYYGTEQGHNNWFYCYGSPEKYALMTYGSTALISYDHWHGPETYQYCHADYMNPGPHTGSMRIWVAESDGEIAITGEVCRIWDGGDGTSAFILKNGEELFSHQFGNQIETAELPESLGSVPVSAGDKIYYYAASGVRFDNGYDGISYRCEISWNTKGETVLSREEVRAALTELSDSYTEVLGVNITEKEYPSGFTAGNGTENNSNPGLWIGAACFGGCGLGMAAFGTVMLVRGRKKQ